MENLKQFLFNLADKGEAEELYKALRIYSPQQAWAAAIEYMEGKAIPQDNPPPRKTKKV